jgi:hypothetical protein
MCTISFHQDNVCGRRPAHCSDALVDAAVGESVYQRGVRVMTFCSRNMRFRIRVQFLKCHIDSSLKILDGWPLLRRSFRIPRDVRIKFRYITLHFISFQ